MNRFRIRYELKAALWFIPLLSLVAFIALAVVTLAIGSGRGLQADLAASPDLPPRSSRS
jgi:hypothetical protein